MAVVLLQPLAPSGLSATPVQASAQQADAARQAPGEQADSADQATRELEVHLLTAEPGDAVWELFGHNAVIVRDPATGFEGAFNYGLFDFNSPGFLGRFLRGTMMYRVGAVRIDAMLASYQAQNRRVWSQELELTPVEKAQLYAALATAVQPENSTYRYEYFLNNCSTKIRDVLDQVLGGRIQRATDSDASATSWRTHTSRLTAPSALGYLGIQLLLGPRGDDATSSWEQMWVPMKLRDTVAGLTTVASDGTEVPLVRSEQLLLDSTRPPGAVAPPRYGPLFLLSGLALALVIFACTLGIRDGRTSAKVAGGSLVLVWGLLTGLTGTLLVLVYGTDHEFMYLNQNVLLFSPLGFALAVLAPGSIRRGTAGKGLRRVVTWSMALVAVAVVLKALPVLNQSNGEWLALAVPVQLSLWWAFTRIIPEQGGLQYAPGSRHR